MTDYILEEEGKMKVKEAIRYLTSMDMNDEIVMIVWNKEDVEVAAMDVGYRNISDKQCKEVLKLVDSTHDAGSGVTWSDIQDAVLKVKEEENET